MMMMKNLTDLSDNEEEESIVMKNLQIVMKKNL